MMMIHNTFYGNRRKGKAWRVKVERVFSGRSFSFVWNYTTSISTFYSSKEEGKKEKSKDCVYWTLPSSSSFSI